MEILWRYLLKRFNSLQSNRLLKARLASVAGGVALLWSAGPVLDAQPGPPQIGTEATAGSEKLAPKETREIPISLADHEALDIDLEQLSGQTVVEWIDPGGKESPFRFTQDGRHGHIRATIASDQAGTWNIKVAPRNDHAVEYIIHLGAPRTATNADVARAAAGNALAQAEKLRIALGATKGNAVAPEVKPLIQGMQANASTTESAYKEAVHLFHEVKDGCGARESLNDLNHFLIDLGRYVDARTLGQQSLAEECADPALKADSFRVLGTASYWLGDLEAAIRYHEQALILYRETGDLHYQGLELGNLSGPYAQEGATGKALEIVQQALDLARRSGDPRGIVFDEETMGAIHFHRGEYQLALEALNRALEDLKLDPYPLVESMAEDNLGGVYQGLGDWNDALAAFKRAEEGPNKLRDFASLADALVDEGEFHLSRNHYAEAEKVFSRALAIASERQLTRMRASALRGLGAAEIGERHYDSGLQRVSEARILAQSLHDDLTEINALNSLGDYYLAHGNFSKAEENFSELRRIAEQDHAASQLVIAWASLARISQAKGDLMSAQASAEMALAIIEDQRSQINAPDLRSSFFQSTRGYFDLSIQILMSLEEKTHDASYARAALEAAENSRARALTDLLSMRAIDIQSTIPVELLHQRNDAQDNLHEVAFRLARLKASASNEERAPLESRLAEAKKKLDRAEGNIRESNRRYSDLVDPARLTLEEIQKKLLDNNSVLLEYWLSDSESYLWEVSSEQMKCYRLPAARKLESLASRLRLLLASGSDLPAGISIEQKSKYEENRAGKIASLSREMGRLLLGPVASRLGTRNIVIVADGSLRGIPFGLLPLSPTRILDQHNGVTYLPSIGALRWLRTKPYDAWAARRLAVFADPVFDSRDARLSAKSENAHAEDFPRVRALRDANTQNLSRLVWSRREAQSIAGNLPKEDSWVALDFEASRNHALQASWQRYDFAHFATHALIDSRNPELSGIVLSLYDKQGKPVDGFLRVTDIYNLSIPAQLVVLSTCDSAADSAAMGNDVYTLADAFFYAGTPRIVASLWTVNDRAAAAFMGLFYRALLLRHATPAVALHFAKVAMARNPRWHSPYYWSGFVLEGDWQ